MTDNNEMEDGEISDLSGDENPLFQYKPLQRPSVADKPTNKPCPEESEEEQDDLAEESDSDSDEDTRGQRPKAKSARAGYWGRRDALVPDDGGGETFKMMAQAFQENRRGAAKKRNNVWGNFIQEESLTAEISGSLGVGRSLKDLNSDRGAEAYDYTQIIKERELEKKPKKKDGTEKKRSGLDDEIDSYWNSNTNDLDDTVGTIITEEESASDQKRGTKRSVKDRLGQKRVHMDTFRNEVLPPPGESRHISEIAEESLYDGSDEDFGKEIADNLQEEKVDMIVDLIKILGRREVWQFYCQTQKVESEGGMMINNGARRRTAGGVLMQLLRTSENEEISSKAKLFFKESQKKEQQRRILQAKTKKKKKFEEEMTEFLNRKKEIEIERMKEKECEMEEEEESQEEMKPLPNILSMIANSLGDKKPRAEASPTAVARVNSFKEPEAPPNSVERSDSERNVIEYDDDFLTSNAETEDIELF